MSYDELYAILSLLHPRKFFSLEVSRISTGVEGAPQRQTVWSVVFGLGDTLKAFSPERLLEKVRADIDDAPKVSPAVGRIGSVSP